MKKLSTHLLVSFWVSCISTQVFATTDFAEQESLARSVDEAASATQDLAIKRLESLSKKYKGKPEEPAVILRLAQAFQQKSSLQFRISHGRLNQVVSNSNQYKSTLQKEIDTLSLLLKKYPSSPEAAESLFMRAKAYEELGKIDSAKIDFLNFVTQYSDAEEAPSANMSLADIAIKANKHEEALGFLTAIETKKESPLYPYALYKKAWSFYNLKNTSQALHFAELHVNYLKNKIKEQNLDSTEDSLSESSLLENTLVDIPLFYFQGLELKQDGYKDIKEAFLYFEKLKPSTVIGKMILRFAKMLRSRGLDDEMIQWKSLALDRIFDSPEVLDTLISDFEFRFDKHQTTPLIQTAKQLGTLYHKHPEWPHFNLARITLWQSVKSLQATLSQNKESTRLQEYTEVLISLYESLIQVLPEKDPGIPLAHANLAEHLFANQHFEQSIEHYRKAMLYSKTEDALNYNFKSIGARYESFKQSNKIPENLTALDFSKTSKPTIDYTDGEKQKLNEWISWIDFQMKAKTPLPPSIDHFAFEAYRALYASGQIAQALKRLIHFSVHYFNSSYRLGSAKLILDTYLESKMWSQAFGFATQLLELPGYRGTAFARTLVQVAADSKMELIKGLAESNQDLEVLRGVEQFYKIFPDNGRTSEALLLGARAAINQNKMPLAQEYLSLLINRHPATGAARTALAMRALYHESQYDYSLALSDLVKYFSTDHSKPSPDDPVLKLKTIEIAFMLGDSKSLNNLVQSLKFCEPTNAPACGLFNKLSQNKISQIQEEALILSQDHSTLDYRSLIKSARTVIRLMTELEPNDLISQSNESKKILESYLERLRLKVKNVVPIRPPAKALVNRIEGIGELENLSKNIQKLPWISSRVQMINWVADLYTDFIEEVSKSPEPKGLSPQETEAYHQVITKMTMPLDEKAQDLRLKALTLGLESQTENSVVVPIYKSFSNKNPSQAKSFADKLSITKPGIDWSPESLFRIDPNSKNLLKNYSDWKLHKPTSFKPDLPSKALFVWVSAVESKNLILAQKMAQEIEEKAYVSPHRLLWIQAISSFHTLGQAEAMAILKKGANNLPPGPEKLKVEQVLAHSTNEN